MRRMRGLVSLVLAASFVLVASSRADAALQIALQHDDVNGGAITVVGSAADFSAVSFNNSYGDFTVTLFGGASNNTALLSDLLSSTVQVRNNGTTTQTLNLFVTQTNYTLPAGSPLMVESGLGGTVNSGTVSLPGIFQAYADSGNNAFGMTDFTNGPQNATLTGSTLDTGSATGLFNRVGLYSLTSVVRFEVSAGGNGNFSTHVNVSVPDAGSTASLLLLGVGLIAAARRKMSM